MLFKYDNLFSPVLSSLLSVTSTLYVIPVALRCPVISAAALVPHSSNPLLQRQPLTLPQIHKHSSASIFHQTAMFPPSGSNGSVLLTLNCTSPAQAFAAVAAFFGHIPRSRSRAIHGDIFLLLLRNWCLHRPPFDLTLFFIAISRIARWLC
jgi:hypothetical protein